MQEKQKCPLCRRALSAAWIESACANTALRDEIEVLCCRKARHQLALLLLDLQAATEGTVTAASLKDQIVTYVRDMSRAVRIVQLGLLAGRIVSRIGPYPVAAVLEPTTYNAWRVAFESQSPAIRALLSYLAQLAGWLALKGYDDTHSWKQYIFDVLYDCCRAGDYQGLVATCQMALNLPPFLETDHHWYSPFPVRDEEHAPAQSSSAKTHDTQTSFAPDFRVTTFAGVIAQVPREAAGQLAKIACAYQVIASNTLCDGINHMASTRPTTCDVVLPTYTQ
jgi:hypothetical protein